MLLGKYVEGRKNAKIILGAGHSTQWPEFTVKRQEEIGIAPSLPAELLTTDYRT
jgi:hypothetical protein